MAHADDKRRAIRAAYVFDQLSLEIAAVKHEIPLATSRNWKRAAKELGDDWDKARGAQMIAGGGIEDVVRQTLAMVIMQVQSSMQTINDNPEMAADVKVKLFASLTDSYSKMMAISKRLMPETDKYAVAMDVIKRLLEFTQLNYPQYGESFSEILSPFGDELASAYGK